MSDQPLTDEELRDHTFEQAKAGDIIGARQTVSMMTDRQYLREAWIAILGKQMDLGDLQGVKETIASFSNDCDWLLRGHWVRDTIVAFARAGDVPGAIEIANKAGGVGLFIALIALVQAGKGDLVGARETTSLIENGSFKSDILDHVNELQRNALERTRGQ
jgi:predicted Rdx family selenoprotein